LAIRDAPDEAESILDGAVSDGVTFLVSSLCDALRWRSRSVASGICISTFAIMSGVTSSLPASWPKSNDED